MHIRLFTLLLVLLVMPLVSRAQLYIAEIMAENGNTLSDEDGDFPDWVEIWNASTGTVSLSGWYLTDSSGNLQKWKFPAVSLTSGARKVVFCSNKDRRNANANLHTNFKLDNDGEYLALVRADGGTVEHHYSPKFPKMGANLAYGLPGDPGWQKLAPYTAAARAVVPSAASTTWYAQTNFDDSLWRDCTQGIGYDTTGFYTNLFGFAGNFQFDMYTKRAQVWLRQKFTLPSTNGITDLRLQMKYDDGVRVWINNKVMFEDNVSTDTVYTASAPTNRPDELNNSWTIVPLAGGQSNLVNGVNLLAIQLMNFGASDTDALLVNEVEGYFSNGGTNLPPGYLYTPTPGAPNALLNPAVGPFVSFVSNYPARPPTGSPPLTVWAKVEQSLNPLSTVRLYYRHMYSNEVMVSMSSNGLGLYSAQIPVSNMAPGQMVRWRISATDVSNVTATAPAFVDPLQNDQYYGTVSLDYITNTLLPIVHWFRATPLATIAVSPGERCSFFYLGKFYDNVFFNQHGQSTGGFAKKSVNIDFNFDNRFMWAEGENLAKDINFMSNYGDKTRLRNTVAWDGNRRAGASWFWCFPINVQLNGSFYGLYEMMEDSDNRWLDRIGYDGEGDLYKAYDSLSSVGGSERKTRQWLDKSDLQSLIDNLNTSIALTNRTKYAYDNIDLARCATYFATLDILSCEDHGHKNYFVYRDTHTTGEWMMLPWDEDLSLGKNWMASPPAYLDDRIFTTNMLYATRGGGNRFYQLIYNAPEFNQMKLRRLRTLMDTLLQTNGTPTDQLIFEAKINEVLNQIDPPGIADSDAYRDYLAWHTSNATTNLNSSGGWGYLTNRQSRQEADRVLYEHLPGRRSFLETTGAYSLAYFIPPSQPPQMPIRFGAMDVKPSGGATQEYFSIINTNSIYVDISGWSITGAVNYTFKPGTVIPGGANTNIQNIGKLFVAKNPKGFRSRTVSPKAGEFCFVQGPYDGQLSARGESLYLVDNTGAPIAFTNWATNTTTSMQNHIRVTEIMYNPAPPTLAESNAVPFCQAEDFEYIEIRTLASGFFFLSINNTVQFTDGIEARYAPTALVTYTTTNRYLFVANTNTFLLRYGSNLAPKIIGTYTGNLDNAGERIRLVDGVGEVIQDFEFDDDWYTSTDGHGFSLVVRNESNRWDQWGYKTNWRPSGVIGGTPGAADPGEIFTIPVLINEALTHTDLPQTDTIELANPTNIPAPVGGWWLTDDFAVPRKYRIPTNTFIPANGYLSFDETHFNEPTNALIPFRLTSTGDDVWLFSADAASNLTGYATTRKFGASQNGVSFGRFINRAADEFFVAQQALTLSLTNAYPLIHPVVVSEIMYHPTDFTSILWTNDNDRDEFIELTSVSTSNTPLYDVNFPTNTWRIRNAVDYDFPTNITLAPGASLILVGFDPNLGTNATAFRAAYAIPTNVPLYGPWSGQLDNSSEQIELKRPDAPNSNEVPYIIVEEIDYRDTAPWPALADGTGKSLQRIELNAFGNDPYNWFAATPVPNAPTDTTLDTDGDGAPDWAEHRAGTDPTDSASYLQMISAGTTNTGTHVRWTGINGKTYTLEATTNLLEAAFVPVATSIPGLAPLTTYLDPAATNLPARHYRIRIEP